MQGWHLEVGWGGQVDDQDPRGSGISIQRVLCRDMACSRGESILPGSRKGQPGAKMIVGNTLSQVINTSVRYIICLIFS